jgi:hypothetical protein
MTNAQIQEGPLTLGELCEAIESGRIAAVERDGMYEVTVGDARSLRRNADALKTTLDELRSRLLFDASRLEEIRPSGEDIS